MTTITILNAMRQAERVEAKINDYCVIFNTNNGHKIVGIQAIGMLIVGKLSTAEAICKVINTKLKQSGKVQDNFNVVLYQEDRELMCSVLKASIDDLKEIGKLNNDLVCISFLNNIKSVELIPCSDEERIAYLEDLYLNSK